MLSERVSRFGEIWDLYKTSGLEEYASKRRMQMPERKAISVKRKFIFTKILEYIYEIDFKFQPMISMYTGTKVPQIKASWSITSDIKGRPRPNELRKWEDFIPQQMIIWDQLIQSEFHLERYFPSMNSIEDKEFDFDVEPYIIYDIGRAIKMIIHHLNKNPATRASLGLNGSLMRFQTHAEILQPDAISDKNVPSNYPPEYFFCQHNGMSDKGQPDLESTPEQRVFFILDHKLPCDLRYDEFKDVIQPMDLNLVDCDSEKSPKERHRWIFAAFITEAYSYMIEEKVEYGCVTTGEMTIFLRVPENDGHNIYYHVSTPKEDLEDFGQSIGRSKEIYTINKPYLTTLGQFFAFTIQAMKSKQRTQNWCKNICENSKKWRQFNNDWPMDANDSEENDQSDSTKMASSQVSGDLNDIPGSSHTQHRYVSQYCTHKCLYGLKNGGILDKACPNWRDHGTHSHLISHGQFLDLIYDQLSKDLDNNVERICTRGSRGVPFKVRLASHGYTFFAKFTPSWFAHCLLYEADIYDRMESIQGTYVPVYLGNIDLKYPYFFGRGVKLVHVMLLSFGGSRIDENDLAKDPDLSQKVENVFHKIHELNILHQDVEFRNILLDGDTGQVIVIDFERAEVLEMQHTVMPKRKKRKLLNRSVQENRNMEWFNFEIRQVKSRVTKLLSLGTDTPRILG